MPYKDLEQRRASVRESTRRHRARKKVELEQARKEKITEIIGDDPVDPTIEGLVAWASQRLRIPPGHPNEGAPMALPPFAVDFLRAALDPGTKNSLLCMGRKNGKTAIIAIYTLGRLVGPLRKHGWRGGVVSVNKEKAAELSGQIEAIAAASGLADALKLRRGAGAGAYAERIASDWGLLQVLAATHAAGQASGFDDAIVDELGLLEEKDRPVINGMRSSTAAKNGRYIALTVHGHGPYVPEFLTMREQKVPGLNVHHYSSPIGCDLEDEEAWMAGNPGLGTIKSVEWMRFEAARVKAITSDQPEFIAFHLNQPMDPGGNPILTAGQWMACEAEDESHMPPREGLCWIGLDLGGSASMTAFALYWPLTGRLETYGAFPGARLTLFQREQRDGVPGRYTRMRDEGYLRILSGEAANVPETIEWIAELTEGEDVAALVADSYKFAELRDELQRAGKAGEWIIRLAKPAVREGDRNIRAFQKAVLRKEITHMPSTMMRSAIAESKITFDQWANMRLDKERCRYGRIDALQCTILAVGEALQDRADSTEGLAGWVQSANRAETPLVPVVYF